MRSFLVLLATTIFYLMTTNVSGCSCEEERWYDEDLGITLFSLPVAAGCDTTGLRIKTDDTTGEVRQKVYDRYLTPTGFNDSCAVSPRLYTAFFGIGGVETREITGANRYEYALPLRASTDACSFGFVDSNGTTIDTLEMSYSRSTFYNERCDYAVTRFDDLVFTRSTFDQAILADDGTWIVLFD